MQQQNFPLVKISIDVSPSGAGSDPFARVTQHGSTSVAAFASEVVSLLAKWGVAPPSLSFSFEPSAWSPSAAAVAAEVDKQLREYGRTNPGVARVPIMQMAEATVGCPEAYFLGDQADFLTGVRNFLVNIMEDRLCPNGVQVTNTWLVQLLTARMKIIKFIGAHPEITSIKPKHPVFITGLPRSGMTLLHYLMGSNPDARALRFFEMTYMSDPTKVVSTSQQLASDPRINEVSTNCAELEKFFPGYFSRIAQSHFAHPSAIEEEIGIMFYNFCFMLHMGMAKPAFTEWLQTTQTKGHIYRFLRAFMQMIQRGGTWEYSHWVLKAPLHMLYINQLVEEFGDDCQIVVMHRNPIHAIPSQCRLVESWVSDFFQPGSCDRQYIGRQQMVLYRKAVDTMMEWEARTNPAKYINVTYEELMLDPIACVQKIYRHFGLQAPNVDLRLLTYTMQHNPQTKFTRATYTPEMYGLTADAIQQEFAPYVGWATQRGMLL
ncbi:sulfotransferase [Pelomyxa schiedti]|nr:sulfotransferase [Pelomyxa schiedti]